MLLIVLLLAWIPCGVLAYGLTLGFFQNRFASIAYKKRTADQVLAATYAILGPIGLFVAALGSRFGAYGLRWRPLSYEEYLAAHKAAYPNLVPVGRDE